MFKRAVSRVFTSAALAAAIMPMTFMPGLARACSAFRMPPGASSHVLVGRNFDWDYGHGLMVINKRGVGKTAVPLNATDTVQWTSAYGSLTFNQVGREFPYGGINEKGLMIEVLWLGFTKWPVTQAPSMNEVQWIQYQLDSRSSVADLVQHMNDVRILPAFAKVHFFVCDATGACATVEGAGGHVEIHSGSTLPISALTNDTYAGSVKYASAYLPDACDKLPADAASLTRFARAACTATKDVSGETLEAAKERANATLDAVSQSGYTKWSIIYDLTARTISLRTSAQPAIKTVSLDQFDFGCASKVKVFDMNSSKSGDVSTAFIDYTRELNRSIVEPSVLTGFAKLPPALVEKLVEFPESTTCATP